MAKVLNCANTPVDKAVAYAQEQCSADGKSMAEYFSDFKTNYLLLQEKCDLALDLPRIEMPVIEPEQMDEFQQSLSQGHIDVKEPVAKAPQSRSKYPTDLGFDLRGRQWLYRGTRDGAIEDDILDTQMTEIAVADLKPSQSQIWLEKVVGMSLYFGPLKQSSEFLHEAPIIVSRDGYILDGHHRFGAAMVSNPSLRLTALKVDMEIRELVKMARSYGNAIGNEQKAAESFEAEMDKVVDVDCVNIVSKKSAFTGKDRNFYRVSFRDSGQYDRFGIPAWASKAAKTMGEKYYGVSGCQMVMGMLPSGKWQIQAILIPNTEKMNKQKALKIANHMQDRIEKEGKWAKKKCREDEIIQIYQADEYGAESFEADSDNAFAICGRKKQFGVDIFDRVKKMRKCKSTDNTNYYEIDYTFYREMADGMTDSNYKVKALLCDTCVEKYKPFIGESVITNPHYPNNTVKIHDVKLIGGNADYLKDEIQKNRDYFDDKVMLAMGRDGKKLHLGEVYLIDPHLGTPVYSSCGVENRYGMAWQQMVREVPMAEMKNTTCKKCLKTINNVKGRIEQLENELETFDAESFNAMSFNQWSQDEMNEELHGGRNMQFKEWLDDEVHTHGNIPLKEWGYEEEHDEPEHQHAETFNAERTLKGVQITRKNKNRSTLTYRDVDGILYKTNKEWILKIDSRNIKTDVDSFAKGLEAFKRHIDMNSSNIGYDAESMVRKPAYGLFGLSFITGILLNMARKD